MAKSKIDDKIGTQIVNYYINDNLSTRKIAKLIGLSSNTISTYLKSKGIKIINCQNIPKINDTVGELIKNYYLKSKLSLMNISKLVNINITTISKYLKSNNIKVVNYQNRTKFDETVFDVIDSEEKAYWLGFIFADGYISHDRNSFELSLCSKDIDHLYKFNVFMKHENNNVKISKVGKNFERCRWEVTNKHLWETLNNYGCTPRKSLTLKFPDIPKKWYKDFIRGYFDGDGCITYSLDRASKKYYPVIFIEGTFEFLEKITNIFKNNNNINKFNIVHDKRKKDHNTYTLRIFKNNTQDVLEYMYKTSNIYLERKYKRYKFFKISRSDKELSEFLAGEIGKSCDANAEVN